MNAQTPEAGEPPVNEEIARRAYDLWEKRGKPSGQDLAIWLEAERQLRGAEPKQNGSTGQMRRFAEAGEAAPTETPVRPFREK